MGKTTGSSKKKKKSKKLCTKDRDESSSSSSAVKINDERFAAAFTRPQFHHPQKNSSSAAGGAGKKEDTDNNNNNNSKVVLDERFSSVLTDPRFQLHVKDKYGRKKRNVNKNKTSEDLGAFYTVVNEKERENKLDEETKNEKQNDDDNSDDGSSASTASSSSSDDESSTEKKKKEPKGFGNLQQEDKDENPASRIAYLTALSRGELEISSSSSSENDDDDDDDQSSDDDDDDDDSSIVEDPVHGSAGVLDPSTRNREAESIEITHEESPYLAVTNLDWAHVRAVDIFVILSSFTPPGAVKRVQVFLSDFGKEKLANELEHGPPSLWKKNKKTPKNEDDEHDDDDDDDDDNKSSNSDDDENSETNNDHNDDNDATESDDADSLDEDRDDDDLPIDDLYAEFIKRAQGQPEESDFDPEKLRAYEASKLKYYFAVAEFTTAENADIAYKEVDGMEFEHSSAGVDLRSIPKDSLEDVIQNRELRDEATSVPGNYVPPEFVVSALQQTSVQCTWESGDTERERMLTKYTSSGDQWASLAENDDLKAYLASDNSSDEESDDDNGKTEKGSKLRKLLGLDDENDRDEGGSKSGAAEQATHSSLEGSGEDDDSLKEEQEFSKEVKYIPGKEDLEEKIRTKLQTKGESKELTPWEKYQEKRKEKRREKRQATRRKRSDIGIDDAGTKPSLRHHETGEENDDFFRGDTNSDGDRDISKKKLSREELELLLAGDNDEEVVKDFDMRGLQRITKNKDKRLRGSRKRKEEKMAANVSGQDFAIDVKDDRFAAVLEGDDGRFGIDRTDPNYKETPAMREILEEQKARRRKKRKEDTSPQQQQKVPPNVNEHSVAKSAGSLALSSLVKSLQAKVATK